MTIHFTAESLKADKTPGAKTMKCTLAEAFRVAGLETVNVNGWQAWFCTPDSSQPGQHHDDPQAVWHIPVSLDKTANDQSIKVFAANHGFTAE